jgi:mannose-6-phosphate isomerase-like protein (cupin superfamily)
VRRYSPAVLCVLGLACSAVVLRAQVPIHPHDVVVREGMGDPVVEVHHEPHHRQVFQHGPMRILDLQIPPGDTSWFHRHEWPVLYVTLSSSASRMQNLGEEWGGGGGRGAAPGRAGGAGVAGRGRGGPPPTAAPASPRATSTTSYIEQPITHRLQNVGERLFRAMVVVNETHGDADTSIEAAGFSGTAELTNNWFRAYRVTLGPGEVTRSHNHRAPVAIFQVTHGKGIGVGPVRFDFNEPGQWAFFDAGHAHELRNTGDRPLEFIEVEIRRQPPPRSAP